MTRLLDSTSFPPSPEQDPFRHGWRYVTANRDDGTEDYVQVPLTLDDVLHPQEGDTIPENTVHNYERDYLTNVVRSRIQDRPGLRVFSDCIIDWGVPGIRNHSPDVSLFDEVRDLDRRWGIFPARKEGARPLLGVEIVSPDDSDRQARDNDTVIKRDHYHRVGVPLYLIVDQEREEGPRTLILLRNTPDGFVEEQADEQGRMFLEPINVLVGLVDNRLRCFDPATNQELGDYAAQVLAREAAERRTLAEVEAREAAQRQARAEAEGRKLAEQQARVEAEGRKLAEEKLRLLEEELRRLRNHAAGSNPVQ